MPDPLAPSEFGGKVGRNGVQPFPHEPTASEKLSLAYRTGADSGDDSLTPDDGSAFEGLLPLSVREAQIAADASLDYGKVWKDLTGA